MRPGDRSELVVTVPVPVVLGDSEEPRSEAARLLGEEVYDRIRIQGGAAGWRIQVVFEL